MSVYDAGHGYTAWHGCICMDAYPVSALSVTWLTQLSLTQHASSIKGTLLWVSPAVVTQSWLHFTATFYHSYHIWKRGVSGPSVSNKSKEVYQQQELLEYLQPQHIAGLRSLIYMAEMLVQSWPKGISFFLSEMSLSDSSCRVMVHLQSDVTPITTVVMRSLDSLGIRKELFLFYIYIPQNSLSEYSN